MPKAMHEGLKRSARKKGLKGERARRYIYGAMVNARRKAKS